VLKTVTVGARPTALAASPRPPFDVYCANNSSASVSVISSATDSVVTTIPTGAGPRAVLALDNAPRAYCANGSTNTVTIINTDQRQAVGTVTVGNRPAALAAFGRSVYVANGASVSVSRIDVFRDSVEAEIPVGNSPVALCASAGWVYCANSAAGSVSVIDPWGDSVVATIDVGETPQALCHDRANDKVYCANTQSSDVSVIDCATNTVIATFQSDYSPVALCHTPDFPTSRVYVAAYDGSRLTVIADSVPVGIAENPLPAPLAPRHATIVRDVLFLPPSPVTAHQSLFDFTGRRVLELNPGPNDVSGLAPGVYFLPAQNAKFVISNQRRPE